MRRLRERLREEGVESRDMAEWRFDVEAEADARAWGEGSVIRTPAAGAPDAVVFPKNRSPFRLDSWREGWFEIQDAGSQAVARAAVDAVGESNVSSIRDDETGTRRERGRVRVLDMCAGNGGKTLAMASELSYRADVGIIDEYVIDAFDVDARRLRHLESNAERAGVSGNVRVVSFEKMRDAARVGNGERLDGRAGADPRYDLVLCDAPCSSTGAMRRTPSMRWLIAGDVAEWREGADDAAAADPLRYSTAWGDGGGDSVFAEVDVSERPATQLRLARPRTATGVPVATCPSPRFSGGSSPRLRGSSARTAARSCTRRVRFSSRRTSRCARGSTSASGMTSSRCLSRRTGRRRPTHSPRGTRTRTSWPRMTSRNWTGTRWTTGRFGRTGSRCDPTCTAATVSTSRGGFENRSPGGTRGAPTSLEEEMDDEAMVRWIEWNVPPCAR